MVAPAAHIAGVTLPDAPVMQANPALPHAEELKKSILDQLAAAAPQARDASHDTGDTIRALLGGLAAGAAGGGSFTQMLAQAGAGASRAVSGERKEIKAETERKTEAQRAFAQLLATQGINIDEANVGTRNANAMADYQTGVNATATGNANANASYENRLKQVMTNLGINEANVGADNTTRNLKASAGLQALNTGVSDINTAGREQTSLNRQSITDSYAMGQDGAGTPQKALERRTGALLTSIGIPQQDDPKDPLTTRNARSVAAQVAAGNKEGAVQGLARQMILTGSYAGLNGLSVKMAQQIKQHIDSKDLEGAVGILNGALSANMASIPALAKHLADMGDPVGKLISDNAKPVGKA